MQDRRSAPAGYRDRRRSRKSERASVKDFIMDEQLLSMDKVLHRCHPSHFAALLFFTFPSCTCVPLAATCHLASGTKWHAEPATWQVQVARRASVTTRAAAHVYLPEQRYQLRSDLALTSRRVAKMGTRWTSCVVSSLAGGFRASPIPISVEVPSARHPWTFPGGFVASASRRM